MIMNKYQIECKMLRRQTFPTLDAALLYALNSIDDIHYHFVTTTFYSDYCVELMVASPANKTENIRIVKVT